MARLVDTGELMRLVDDERHDRRTSWVQVAEEAGLNYQALFKLKTGLTPQPALGTFIALLEWVDLDDEAFMTAYKRITEERS